jgi:hypothetical protein
MAKQSVQSFVSGTHNLLPDEIIPKDAASASSNWLTRDGHIELSYGRQLIGAAGTSGKVHGLHIGYKVDGTAIKFQKVGTKIRFEWAGVWNDVITGLTAEADYVFTNYQSLAGAFVYIFGVDGIYKIATANPASYTSLYDSTKNFKGYGFIDKGRTILWGRAQDPTGLYGSWIDNQAGVSGSTGVYTTITGEALADVASGTLAFKAAGATRTCFGVTITDTSSGEVFTDNLNGVLTGSLGSTGTINYTSGAFTITGQSGAGAATYQWENSNLRGVTDFSKTATRLAGEGFTVRQDAGGDAIKVVVPLDGVYFSMKSNSCYRFELDATDLAPTNEIFRTDIGVPTLRSAVGTGSGIMFLNTANPTKPALNLLQRNPLGDTFTVGSLFPHYAFENFSYTDVCVDTWDKYALVSCRSAGATANDRLLLCDMMNKTVDETYYTTRCFAKTGGYLYSGDSVSWSTHELFTGFDDIGFAIENSWEGNAERFGDDVLKKIKRFRIKGKISPAQSLAVYVSYDNADYELIGTVLGSGDYVDYSISYAIGASIIGGSVLGGEITTDIYQYFTEFKLSSTKFRKRKIKFVAGGIGYASVEMIEDFDIWTYQDKIPKKYRVKQNVSLDGLLNNQ